MFNGQIPLDKLKLNQKSYYYLQNSAFWDWLSMESQPQNPELGIILKTFTHANKTGFGCSKETSHWDVSFTHLQHV